MAQSDTNHEQEIVADLEEAWRVARKQPRNQRGQTWEDLVDWPKLREMMQLARELDKRLMKDAAKALSPDMARRMIVQGGNTLLGNHYAKGDCIFFGENPGIPPEDMEKFVTDGWPAFQYGPVGWPYHNRLTEKVESVEEQCDGSWDHYPNVAKSLLNYNYAKMCRWFFDDRPDGQLHMWIQKGTTHALVYPWRTVGEKELGNVNKQLLGQVEYYSCQLLRIILTHHRPALRWIIVSGKGAMVDFQVMSGLHWAPDGEAHYKGVHHQWSKWRSEDGLTLLQVPHFAWAKKLEWLAQCRDWFKQQIGVIPLSANSNRGRPDSQ